MPRTPTRAAAVLLWILSLARCQEQHVSCELSADCVLPCSFRSSDEEVIHWRKRDTTVHSFYYGSDQLQLQDKRYSGRTSLFRDLISRGNASLLLQRAEIQDQGRYSCYVSTTLGNSETSVSMQIMALIQSVDMEKTDSGISCVVRGAYPEPSFNWSTDPPTAPGSLSDRTQAAEDKQGLYSATSTVTPPEDLSGHTFICSASTADGTSWTASLRQQEDLHGAVDRALVIPCPIPESSHPSSNTSWTFERDGNLSLILWRDVSMEQPKIMPLWDRRARGLSEDGSLQLQNPEGPELTGTYTCRISATHTLHVVRTKVTIAGASSDTGSFTVIHAIIVIVVALLVTGIVILVLAWQKGWLPRSGPPPKGNSAQTQMLHGVASKEGGETGGGEMEEVKTLSS
ncbi:hypothetical protein AGOR_G00142020 [Albula goreensis]|uniref:Ig-like domain-containing protein n=1 Tax=Albula goreensis TaxID=1534307 RepID=A0A8T3D924_9TELE|nr:hypothetical protein AGOR_G00142020 [Albula goreensis]